MGQSEVLRAKYDAVREEFEDSMFDAVSELLLDYASGDNGLDIFGTQMDALDTLCMLDLIARQMKYIILGQAVSCKRETYPCYSWDDIAAALGVTRQAAIKRFKPYMPAD